jgi:bifunctional DNA-binding transcriptional regulator/antitoxin component of YhaV-PrlF toxin-antitoxin module
MSAKTLSAKRQVVLPVELCRQMALVPGSQVQVSLAPDGTSILIRPATSSARKPASVLFGRHVHRGTPVSVDEMQGVVQVARQASRQRAGGRR